MSESKPQYKRDGYEFGAYLCNQLMQIYRTDDIKLVPMVSNFAKTRSLDEHCHVDLDVRTPNKELLEDNSLESELIGINSLIVNKNYNKDGKVYGNNVYEVGLYHGDFLDSIYGSDDIKEFLSLVNDLREQYSFNYGIGNVILFSPMFGSVNPRENEIDFSKYIARQLIEVPK
ncbi:MAG: hypothetical protein ACOC1K_08020 [Nanoarchaeota archaeon]